MMRNFANKNTNILSFSVIVEFPLPVISSNVILSPLSFDLFANAELSRRAGDLAENRRVTSRSA